VNEQPKKLLDQACAELCQRVRDLLRKKQYAIRTEQAYVDWIKRFLLFHDNRHPLEMDAPEIRTFLVHLTSERNVAPSTQEQALSALLFLYKEVLGRDPGPVAAVRPKRPERLPAALTREEVKTIIAALSGLNQLIVKLLYGSGLHLLECLRLRVGDLDLDYRQITVRDSQGRIHHVTLLPGSLVQPLRERLLEVKHLHRRDLDAGYGAVYLPPALEQEYPDAHREWRWQYLFPAANLSVDPRTGIRRRHHLGESGPQKALRQAALSTGLSRRVTCQILRHSFAVHLLEAGYTVRTVQELLGHRDVEATLVYSRLLDHTGLAIRSPLD
jgi:integron integrase